MSGVEYGFEALVNMIVDDEDEYKIRQRIIFKEDMESCLVFHVKHYSKQWITYAVLFGKEVMKE